MFSIILCGCVATLLLPSVVPSSLLLNHLPELEHLSIQLNQLLRSRSPLGLEAIDDVALMDRFDSKYVVPQAWLKNLVEILEEHAVLTIQNQVSTLYNNLYFDTPNGQCLEDHTRERLSATRFASAITKTRESPSWRSNCAMFTAKP